MQLLCWRELLLGAAHDRQLLTSQVDCYGPNMSPKVHVWKPFPNVMVFGGDQG